jgi:hypothetical protein
MVDVLRRYKSVRPLWPLLVVTIALLLLSMCYESLFFLLALVWLVMQLIVATSVYLAGLQWDCAVTFTEVLTVVALTCRADCAIFLFPNLHAAILAIPLAYAKPVIACKQHYR